LFLFRPLPLAHVSIGDNCCTWSHSVTYVRSCQDSRERRLGTNIYAPGRIRTRNSSKRAVADLLLRPDDHRNRRLILLRWLNVGEVDRLFNMRVEKEEFVQNSGKWWKIVSLMEFYFMNQEDEDFIIVKCCITQGNKFYVILTVHRF